MNNWLGNIAFVRKIRTKCLETVDSATGNKQFQLYLAGQAVRLWGWALQAVAATWLVYSATKSTFMLAMVGFSNFVPLLVLGLTGGWVADRFDRRKTLLVTQWLKILVMIGFAAEAFFGPHINAVLLLCFAWGVIFVYDQPTRQAFLIDIIDPAKRVNAVGLNLAVCTSMQMLGLVAAGVLLSYVGVTICFLLAAVAFGLTQWATLRMASVAPRKRTEPESAVTEKVRAGDAIKFVFGNKSAAMLFLKTGIVTMIIGKYGMLLPVISEKLLAGGAGTLAALSAAGSVGATIAALIAAGPRGKQFTMAWPNRAILLMAPLLVAFALSRDLTFSLVIATLMGLCGTIQSNGNYSLLQEMTPDKLQGRTIAVYLMAMSIIDQVGSWLTAWIETTFGLAVVMYVGAAVALAYFYVFHRLQKKTNPSNSNNNNNNNSNNNGPD